MRSLDHVVLEVDDPSASVDFYRRVLGLRPVRIAEFRRGRVPFPSARVAPGSVIDFFPRTLWRGRSKHNPNHFCLTYPRAGFEQIRRRLARLRIRIEREDRHNFGARGFGHALYIRDLDGLLVEVRHYPKRTPNARQGRA